MGKRRISGMTKLMGLSLYERDTLDGVMLPKVQSVLQE